MLKHGRRGVRKEHAEGRRPTMVAKKRSESVILDVSLLQPTSSLFSGIMLPIAHCSGSLLGIYMRLTKSSKARTKLCA